MTVLDAYAVVAYMRGEGPADEVACLLEHDAVLTAVNAIEVVDQMVRVFGRDADDVEARLAILVYGGLQIPPLDPQVAIEAGRLRARYYHRERCTVSLADCTAAAMAITSKRPLATADPALVAVLRAEGAEVIALPDSRGRRP